MKFVRLAAAIGLSALLFGAAPAVATTPDLHVVVDGTALVFDQPPIERAGTVYVPLRGVFERLGAHVFFDAGRVVAKSDAHRIELHAGETSATVDGTLQTLDAPPIVIAGRTLVPLRFVSQALGATVTYDSRTRTIALGSPLAATPPGTAAATETPLPRAAPSLGPAAKNAVPIELRLLRREPVPGSTLDRTRPEISATFAESVIPATVRLALDGSDAVPLSYVSSRAFVLEPRADLAAGPHDVAVAGLTPDNERFEEHWTFTTSAGPNTNFLDGLEPANGVALGGTTIVVSGYTRAKSRVRIVATTSASIPTFSEVTDGSTTVDAVANSKGYFDATLALVDRGSGLADIHIASTAPGGDLAIKTLRLRL